MYTMWQLQLVIQKYRILQGAASSATDTFSVPLQAEQLHTEPDFTTGEHLEVLIVLMCYLGLFLLLLLLLLDAAHSKHLGCSSAADKHCMCLFDVSYSCKVLFMIIRRMHCVHISRAACSWCCSVLLLSSSLHVLNILLLSLL
jgi:hypothetical protein